MIFVHDEKHLKTLADGSGRWEEIFKAQLAAARSENEEELKDCLGARAF